MPVVFGSMGIMEDRAVAFLSMIARASRTPKSTFFHLKIACSDAIMKGNALIALHYRARIRKEGLPFESDF